jgi:hypothetical protein
MPDKIAGDGAYRAGAALLHRRVAQQSRNFPLVDLEFQDRFRRRGRSRVQSLRTHHHSGFDLRFGRGYQRIQSNASV